MNKSWKTTLLGVLTIISAVSAAGVSFLKNGTMPDFGLLIGAITAGIGLITAKDSNVTGGDVKQ